MPRIWRSRCHFPPAPVRGTTSSIGSSRSSRRFGAGNRSAHPARSHAAHMAAYRRQPSAVTRLAQAPLPMICRRPRDSMPSPWIGFAGPSTPVYATSTPHHPQGGRASASRLSLESYSGRYGASCVRATSRLLQWRSRLHVATSLDDLGGDDYVVFVSDRGRSASLDIRAPLRFQSRRVREHARVRCRAARRASRPSNDHAKGAHAQWPCLPSRFRVAPRTCGRPQRTISCHRLLG